MSIKKAYNYQLKSSLGGIGIYYFVLLLVFLVFTASAIVVSTKGSGHGRMSAGSTEMITGIFIFVLGLNSFKENFYLMLQNGLSRRSTYAGSIATLLTISGGMAIVDTAINLLLSAGSLVINNFTSGSLMAIMYNVSGPVTVLYQPLFSFGIYTFASFLGYFITVMYYTLGKGGKVAVSVGVPALLLIALPALDHRLLGGMLGYHTHAVLLTLMGVKAGQPLIGMVFALALATVFAAFTWLMMRHAPVKK